MPVNTNDFGDDDSIQSSDHKGEHGFAAFGDFIKDKAHDVGLDDAFDKGSDFVKDQFKESVDTLKDGFGGVGDFVSRGVDKLQSAERKIPGLAALQDNFGDMGDTVASTTRSGIAKTMSNFGVSMPNGDSPHPVENSSLGVQSKASAQRDAVEHGHDPELSAGDQVDLGMDY